MRTAIFSVRHKWYDIGLELEIPFQSLDVIKTDCPSNSADCLREMLKQWLSRMSPAPSWSALVEALSSEPVGEKRLAGEIHRQFCLPHEQANHEEAGAEATLDAGPSTQEVLVSQIQRLQGVFGKLKDDVFETIKDQPVDTFKVRLTSFDVEGQKIHYDFVQDIVERKITIVDIWVRLNSYWNFLNYDLLLHILSKFPNEDLQERMGSYRADIQEFSRNTRLCEFVKCWPVCGDCPPIEHLRMFVVKSKKDWDMCTLEDLEHLKGSLTRRLFLPKFAMMVQTFSEGCVSVTYSVPASLVAHLQAEIKNTKLKELLDMGIEAITVDGVVCYEAPLLQYTAHLKQIYTSRSPLQPLSDSKPKHPFQFRLARIERQQLSQEDMDRFTRESLRGDMDDVVYKKTAMEVGELGVLPDGSRPKVVLIEGAPGVGKTTFAWDQCRQWAEGKLLQAYSIVLLLPLRDNNIRQITSIRNLFRHSKPQVRDEVIKTALEANGKGCLIWLEAWDELVDNLRSDSLLTDLIRGIQLPAATIYITSRPWATGGLVEQMGDRISQHTELLASAKEQVEMHKKEISEQTPETPPQTDAPKDDSSEKVQPTALNFIEYIESHPAIHAAMYTPVTAAIVAQVFKSAPHSPPATVTQLYSAYIHLRLEQYLAQHPEYSDMNIRVRTLADLPDRVLADFQQLCALAYEGVSQQMIVFSSLPEGVSTLGLLQSVPQVYEEGEDQESYNFLHYTVQEYLAALHLSQLHTHKQMTVIENKYGSMKVDSNRPWMEYFESTQFKTTFQFLAGITKLVEFPVQFLSKLRDRDAATLYSWLYESQNLPVLRSVLGSSEREMELPYCVTTTDYFVAGYCLAHSNCSWEINISIDDVAMEFLSKGCNHQLGTTDISSKIVSASFGVGSITADGAEHFLTIPKSLLQHIQYLNLCDNKLDRRACELLAEGVQRMPCLETLNLSGNPLGCGGAVPLVSSLHSTRLRELNLPSTHISDPDFDCIANYIHSTTSLNSLDIGGRNDLSVESIDSLCRALSANSSVRRLDMTGCYLTTAHCVSLGQLLRQCKIEELDLILCSVTSDGVEKVMSGLSENHTLRRLIMYYNPIGSEGAVTMATMLRRNSSLETLDLQLCSIGSSGGVELGAALESNKTLRELWLGGNALGDDGVRGLCVGLENNSSLKVLYLNGDESLGEEGVLLLLKCVEEKNRSLKKLQLPDKYKRDISSALQSRCVVRF